MAHISSTVIRPLRPIQVAAVWRESWKCRPASPARSRALRNCTSRAAGCDAVPDAVKFDLFDMAVNSGVKTAIRTLQRAVGVEPDGIIGNVTMQAIGSMHPARFVARFNGHRLQFMSSLSTWPAFGRGWANRIAKNLIEA